jgi:hypothetical protein
MEVRMTIKNILMYEDSYVKDFHSWKALFDDGKPFREKYGFLKEFVFQDVDDPNHISIVFEVESEDRAVEWMESDLLHEYLHRGGVIGAPRYTFRH